MGIQGLLPLLKSIQKPTHLRTFSGQTLGVDAYGWLHRGTVSCAIELAEGKPTRKHIDFALHRVRMLIHFGVKPYLVFDGDYLPSKAHTEKERATRRKESKRVGLEMLRMGRSSQAQLELQKAVDVTPAMARELIEELKRMDVPYIVAPYEADPQLAYLEKQGIIDGVISEDSDLLVFGVQCLLTKLDQYGECIAINRKDFTSCRDISLVGWTDKEFRMMAMLSGCDYLPGIDKMGLKTAYRLVRKHKTIERVIRTVQFDGKMRVPTGYLESFANAERTFLHQWVFCPEAHSMVHLTALPLNVEASSMPFIGQYVEPEAAAGVACGDLDPNTKRPIPLPQRSFQHPAARSRTVQAPDEKQGKPITEFFRKRIPLAELDPNSFRPSASQQRLLDRYANASSASVEAPIAGVANNARLTIPHAPSSSAPQQSRRVASNPLPLPRRASPKRQRLCSDTSIGLASRANDHGLKGTTSPFFANTSAQASPSIRTNSRKARNENFDLWSDDSTAEAIADVAATTNLSSNAGISSPRKRKKIEVFRDPMPAEESSIGDMTQNSIITTSTEAPHTPASVGTPDTSFAETDSPRQASVFSKGISATFASFRYNPNATTRKSPVRTKSAPLFTSTPLQFVSTAATRPPAKKAARKAPRDSGIGLPSSPLVATQGSEDADPDGAEDIIDDAEWLTIEQQSLSSLSGLPNKGSEDLLVPESPEANEDGGGMTAAKLNLSKFAFPG